MNYIIINRFNMLINIAESLRPHQLSNKITSKISFKKAPVLKESSGKISPRIYTQSAGRTEFS